MFAIYELTPAPWGDAYRFVQGYERKEDAKKVINFFKTVDVDFHLYKVIEHKEIIKKMEM